MSEVNGTDGISAGERVNKNGGRPTHPTKGPGRTVTDVNRLRDTLKRLQMRDRVVGTNSLMVFVT